MKRIFLLLGVIISAFGSYSQTTYTTSYTPNGGNPGGLNTDNDDVVTTWTTIVTGAISNNQWSTAVPMPFSFNYFGSPVSQFRASANGLITFSGLTAPALPNNNENLPTSLLPDSSIACFWEAFTSAPPTAANDVVAWKVVGSAPNRQLWIKWASFEMGAPSVSYTNIACVLEETTDKIYLVEGYTPGTPLLTTTAGLSLSSTTSVQFGTKNRPQTLNTSNTPTDNDYITFTPYTQTAMSYVSSDASQPITSNIAKNSVNEAVLRLVINTTGELSPIAVSQFALNTTGTTTLANITNAKLFYTGKDSAFNTSVQFGSTVTSPAATFNISGTQQLLPGDNYFWLTYSISATALAGNTIDAGCSQITINSVAQTPTTTAPSGSRLVSNGLSGTYTVGTGGAYTYLSDAFKDINVNRLSGPVTLSIISDIDDTASCLLTYSNPNAYSINILPSADVLRNITARLAAPLLELSGTKNLVIDGKGPVSGSGKYLRFLNKDTGSTISLIHGANMDSIRNTIIEGTSISLIKGIVNLGISANTPSGVQNIFIGNNDIRDRSDSNFVPSILIYSAGSLTLVNQNITISNNNLFNFRRSGVYVNSAGNGGNWTISGNHFYYNTSVVAATGDVVPIMLIPGSMAENNHITNNYIGGQAPFCGGSPWLSSNGVNWVAMNINTGLDIGTSVQGNTIQNLNMTTTATVDFAGIRIESGRVVAGNITGNTIGHPTTPNSISNSARLTLCIYAFTSSLGELIVANNTIANITGLGTTTSAGVRGISIQGGAAVPNVYNNTVYNLSSTATNTSALTSTVLGIGLNSGSEAGPSIVRNNKVYNIAALATTANTFPVGIVIDNSSANGLIEGNIVYNVTNISSGATAALSGMQISSGVVNWICRNNMVSLTNAGNTNSVTIRGISDNNSSNTISYWNNTVYIGGTASSGALHSFAFERRAASAISLRNNIFYNERAGGTGVHAAIANVPSATTTNWTSTTSGYNLLISKTSGTTGAWSNTFIPQSFGQWQTTSTGDATSWADTSANVPSASFFRNPATGDLTIDSSNALCWYVNGKGIALAGNAVDVHGQARSTSVTTGGVDIGVDEFPTTTLPPFATVTGNLNVLDSSTFTFAGRTLAKVYWNSGFPPTALDMRYYSGTNPPSPGAGKNYFNSYYRLIPTGGVAYNADVKLYYDSALFGTVPNAASISMADLTATTWNNNPATVVNTSEQSFRSAGVSTLNIFTGTDAANPLPTELIHFAAQSENQQDVRVYWNTVSEKNADRFEVEVSVDENVFELAGTINANGNTNTIHNYAFIDAKAFDRYNSNKLYYRLKMIDMDGAYTYSKIVRVGRDEQEEPTVELYPNPYTPSTQLVITAPDEQKGSIMISDIRGNIVSKETLVLQKGINTISPDKMSVLPSGIYFIKVSVELNHYNFKLVK